MKILIADDEKLVRYSLVSMLKEIGIPEKDIFISVNGEDFIEQVKRYSPDIAFVDIKMPKLNGIDAIRRIKELSPYTQYYILTCYSQFDYAQQAIDIGVSGYMLKPVSSSELNSVIKKFRDSKKLRYKTVNSEFENYINALSNKTISIENIEVAYIKGLQFFGAAIIFDSCINETEKSKIQVSFCENLREEIEPLLDKNAHFAFFTLENGSLNVVFAWNSSTVKNEIENRKRIIIKRIVNLAAKISGKELAVTLFVLPLISGYIPFMGKLKKLNSLSILRVTLGLEKIHYFNNILEAGNQEMLVELSGMLVSLVAFYNERQYLKYLENLQKLDGMLIRENKHFDSSIFPVISDYLKYSIGLPKKNFTKPSTFINNLKEFGTRLLYEEGNKGKLPGDIIGQVKEYAEANYMKNIGLAQIAYHLNITPNYLSMLFHQKTGRPFVKYITEIRMEKAKELLAMHRIKVNEAARMVGYFSPRYFSKLFKKKFGCYPSEYFKGLKFRI